MHLAAAIVGLVWLAFGLTSQAQAAQTDEAIPYAPDLQRVLESAISSTGGTGMAAAVALEPRGFWKGATGMSNPLDSTRIHPDLLFAPCSIGKTYVAALTLQLVDEGRLSLDDPVGTWIPAHRHVDSSITVRQLLNHTSGLADYVKHPRSPYALPVSSLDDTRVWTAEEILRDLLAEPHFAPGDGWRYSTTNYLLLRLMLERLTGSSLSELVETRLLTPLGLRGTVPIDGAEPLPDGFEIAHNWYDVDGDGRLDDLSLRSRNWYSIVPHLVYATAGDLARWSRALFSSDMLTDRTRRQMIDFHRPTPDEPFSGYGLGVGELPAEMVSGETAWGHPGRDFGWTAAMLYFPRLRVHMAVALNDNNLDCLFATVDGLLNVIQANGGSTQENEAPSDHTGPAPLQ
jgi:D-alanyl-D-alanine carboxypeptidase